MKKPASKPRARGTNWGVLLAGLAIGALLTVLFVMFVGMPLALGHRNDLPLEKLYGGLAVRLATMQAGSAQNPVAQNARAVQAGMQSYTGSCSVCHGANGDGKGMFGQSIYPPATDLRQAGTQAKSDAALFWIIKNGLSFAGMPAFGGQYNDQSIWALVAYTRSLSKTSGSSPLGSVPAPTGDQLAMADPQGDAVHRGAAVYYAAGCEYCHGAVGNAPGELRLRGGGREGPEVVRRGRQGMPAYTANQITDAQLQDLIAYLNTLGGSGG